MLVRVRGSARCLFTGSGFLLRGEELVGAEVFVLEK